MTMTTSMSGIEIVPAAEADIALAAGLVAAAFHDLDVARWQIPDEQARRAIYPGYFEEYVRHALEHGSVEMTADLTAVAVWIVETGEQTPAPQPPAGRMAAALGAEAAARIHAFELALHAHEPVGLRFEKLALLAVRPDCQGQGLGTELLVHHLVDLDRRLIPAYLEAASEPLSKFYGRFGFDGRPPIGLDDGLEMFPSWREPQGIDAH